MRNLQYFVIVTILVAFIIGGFFYWWDRQNVSLISPVLGISKRMLSENLWFPKNSLKSFGVAPEISATAAFFVETQSGEVLYEKNSKKELPIASLNKIMAVIIALENHSRSELFKVSQKASEVEPDKMFLIPDEKLTLEELLTGIFLISANDAAEVLAEGTVKSREEFINLMNLKAKQLGMNETYLLNPTGLDEDNQKQYSSAFDVALMSRYAIRKWPFLVEITSKEHVYLPRTDNHQDYDMYSGINLLTTYPGVVGFKTGYTPEAGLTLVTLARRGDREVLGVLLGSTNRRDDAKLLLDYSFQKLRLE